MKCPHCEVAIHPTFKIHDLGHEGVIDTLTYRWRVLLNSCPACAKPIVQLEYTQHSPVGRHGSNLFTVFPKNSYTRKAPPEVPPDIADDYNEACLVLHISPKASAALSRRCLQHILLKVGVSKSDNLSSAIDDALKSSLPKYIAENLDAIRNIGNFAAHPMKCANTGEIVPVEPQEAEWNLDVLDSLFDFYFVMPAANEARKAALNQKLSDAGKKTMKSPRQ